MTGPSLRDCASTTACPIIPRLSARIMRRRIVKTVYEGLEVFRAEHEEAWEEYIRVRKFW